MGIKLTPATFATVAPFFEAFEPLESSEGTARFTELEALMDMMVGDEPCRVWSATVISLENDGTYRACALVVGPRFPDDAEPAMFELSPLPEQGYAVCGSIVGWAGLIREAGKGDSISTK